MSQKQNNSCAILLAVAMQQLLPDAVRIGPWVTVDNFGYDFLYSRALDDQILPLLAQKLHQIINKNLTFTPKTMMRENAADFFTHHKLPIQADLVASASENLVQICEVGPSWYDRSPGELLESSNEIEEVELTDLQLFFTYYPTLGHVRVLRITGVVFSDKKEVKAYRKCALVAKKNDPNKLCRELNLLTFFGDETEGAEPIWLSSGNIVRDLLLEKWKKSVRRRGYQIITTPRSAEITATKKQISPLEELFPMAGDSPEPIVYDFEEREYGFYSPFDAHAALFDMQQKPSNDMVPFRTAELYQRQLSIYSKDTSGFFRSRTCFGDALHIFCGVNHLIDELVSSLKLIQEMNSYFPFPFAYSLILPKQSKGKESFIQALENCGFQYNTSIATVSITGPRFEIQAVDLRGRHWPFSVIGIDEYRKDRAIWRISTTLFFSLERLLALLVERDGGMLPFWLAPVQVIIIPVHERHRERSKWLLEQLQLHGIRAILDEAAHLSLPERIYTCHSRKACFVVVIGDHEVKQETLSVRCLETGESERAYSLDAFLDLVSIKTRSM